MIRLTRAKVDPDLIVSMIHSQTGHFQLGADDLISLKSAGVPDKVVAAMLARQSGSTPSPGAATPNSSNDPNAPHESGIYLYRLGRSGAPQLVMLEQAAYQGSKTGGLFATAMTYGIKKAKMKAVIPGQHASLRVSDPQPVFYFYFEDKAAGLGKGLFSGGLSNPNQFALVKLEIAKTCRETIIGEFGAFGATTGTHEKSMVTFKSERLRSGVYKVTIAQPLEAGEYCFLASLASFGAMGAGASGAAQIFDFGVGGE